MGVVLDTFDRHEEDHECADDGGEVSAVLVETLGFERGEHFSHVLQRQG